jgi:hypothetical protein
MPGRWSSAAGRWNDGFGIIGYGQPSTPASCAGARLQRCVLQTRWPFCVLLEQRQQEDAAKLDAFRRAVATGVADMDEGRFTVIDADRIAAAVAGMGASAVKRSTRRRTVPKRSGVR